MKYFWDAGNSSSELLLLRFVPVPSAFLVLLGAGKVLLTEPGLGAGVVTADVCTDEGMGVFSTILTVALGDGDEPVFRGADTVRPIRRREVVRDIIVGVIVTELDGG